jgi:hypothetical protein
MRWQKYLLILEIQKYYTISKFNQKPKKHLYYIVFTLLASHRLFLLLFIYKFILVYLHAIIVLDNHTLELGQKALYFVL